MCECPFWSCPVKKYDVKVYVVVKGRKFALCEKCWEKLAESDIQW